MIIDFGNRNKGVKFEKLECVPLVEKIMKQLEFLYPEKGSFIRFVTPYA